MRFSKVHATLFVAIVLMLSMASCHKDSVMLNPLASFDIELQKFYLAAKRDIERYYKRA